MPGTEHRSALTTTPLMWPAALAPLLRRALRLREIEDGVHERDVAESLREVAHEALLLLIVLFRNQPEVIADPDQALDEGTRLLAAAEADQIVRVPEAAGEEGALAPRQAVRLLALGVVAQDEAVPHQVLAGRRDGADHGGIVLRQEAHMGDEEQARVEPLRAVILHE